ncbi:MAG: 23S rRNA (adenine(2503)-C(2))-methyltransferase RlmN [Gemmatimonadetes bacterium]|nr:23S rRNA (adenine(2503)-C(2))-methyltransferase RlmN [Gemmatimonadota bacterium]MYA10089.1 23S rRNA (adenine(2503)-C(2))-methyltransferase RlmN [Gemmatimonadota bacterium]MYE71186.1 23S rRNA (adenine(2503)-C(2))-methyltransferase RlmN [Gemmatimonadota bacterium]MYJ69662.1 23S rRNA (adenine(2503)-C(2))-methyltransferase RlmN [Gemmatimonadota bacterium]
MTSAHQDTASTRSGPPAERPNLLGMTPAELGDAVGGHFRDRGQPAYRARQVARWVHASAARSIGEMTDLPLAERDALERSFRFDEPVLDTVSVSADGTAKHLWMLRGGEVVESVLIPAPGRLTLCISSQAGCALACRFCATGWSGFGRQLSAAEIAGQYRASARWAGERGMGNVSNVVFMGMGEPLANRGAVFPALTILNSGYGLGARRITVSTVGVIPGIEALTRRPEQFRLALSLHAPVPELRRELIPLEQRYPLDQLITALEAFNRGGGRRVTFEYTMIRGVNDDPALLPPLIDLATRVQAFVNLIPFNPIPYVDWRPSHRERVQAFRCGLDEAGVPVAVREPRGRDIDAACGQLRATRYPAQRTRSKIRPQRISRSQGKGRSELRLYEK